jgi:hypothetical protein
MECETMAKVEVSEEEKKEVYQKVVAFQAEVLASWRKSFVNPNAEPVKIVYCMNFYAERVAQVAKCLRRVAPHLDRCVLVHDGTPKPSEIDILYQLSKKKAEFYYREWDDHFSKQRNAYLDHVKEGEWVCVSDPDELFSLSFLQEIREILTQAEKEGVNILGINAHDITTELDGTVTKTVSNWFKQLIFKFEEGVRYVGCVHETLLPGLHGWRSANLDPHYYYEHHKSMLEVKERGARNVFAGGGGNNVVQINPMYTEWHRIADRLGIKTWPQMRSYIRKGNVHLELKHLFIKYRNSSGWDWENESRDPFIWYKALFPEEMNRWDSNPQPPSKGSPPEVMSYVEEQYLKILGRNADDHGKKAYTDAILRGAIKREDLPNVLLSSEEYKQKHATIEEARQ